MSIRGRSRWDKHKSVQTLRICNVLHKNGTTGALPLAWKEFMRCSHRLHNQQLKVQM